MHPVAISAVVGHKRVELASEVYDRATLDEKRQALGVVGRELGAVTDSGKTLARKELVSAEGIEPSRLVDSK